MGCFAAVEEGKGICVKGIYEHEKGDGTDGTVNKNRTWYFSFNIDTGIVGNGNS